MTIVVNQIYSSFTVILCWRSWVVFQSYTKSYEYAHRAAFIT